MGFQVFQMCMDSFAVNFNILHGGIWTFVAPLKNKMGFLQSHNKSKVEILNEQFQSVFTKENINNFPNKGKSPYSTIQSCGTTPVLSDIWYNSVRIGAS
jgi:hypothetical protein